MSQLIALIIAIALGAIVTAIGYVFLGDAFTSNSERGVALQLVNQASQVEMAMTAYRASEAGSAWSANGGASAANGDAAWTAVLTGTTGLVTEGFLKDVPVAPVDGASYTLQANGQNVYMVLQAANTDFTNEVCIEVRELAGDTSGTMPANLSATAITDLETALGTNRYNCFTDGTDNFLVYGVE